MPDLWGIFSEAFLRGCAVGGFVFLVATAGGCLYCVRRRDRALIARGLMHPDALRTPRLAPRSQEARA